MKRRTKIIIAVIVVLAIAGITTASFYGWLPLYLPELFATRVRATGQGFAFNFGRILAAIGTLQMGALLPYFSQTKTAAGLTGGYPVICSYVSAIYLFGMVIIAEKRLWVSRTSRSPRPSANCDVPSRFHELVGRGHVDAAQRLVPPAVGASLAERAASGVALTDEVW